MSLWGGAGNSAPEVPSLLSPLALPAPTLAPVRFCSQTCSAILHAVFALLTRVACMLPAPDSSRLCARTAPFWCLLLLLLPTTTTCSAVRA
jgi:hypothetical protein